VSLFDYRLPAGQEIVLVVGAESGGVSPTLLQLCDEAVYLPMHGQNTSMNVSVALGAAVYLLLMQLQ
jgi:tRNA G18 (ribose-2'-O)-methylase SpoU